MKKIKNILCSIGALLLFCSCDDIISELNSTDNTGKNMGENIVSVIGNKVDEIGADVSLTYLGQNNGLKTYAENLKSSDISSEMKNSSFFTAITSIIWNDCICIESGNSFVDKDKIYSLNYLGGYYNICIQGLVDLPISYVIMYPKDDDCYFVNDDTKEYYVEKNYKSQFNNDLTISESLYIYEYIAKNGKIIGAGKETVFGKEFDYEDISVDDTPQRFYFDGKYTMYLIDPDSGEYSKLANTTEATITVPFSYKEVSAEQFTIDGLNAKEKE